MDITALRVAASGHHSLVTVPEEGRLMPEWFVNAFLSGLIAIDPSDVIGYEYVGLLRLKKDEDEEVFYRQWAQPGEYVVFKGDNANLLDTIDILTEEQFVAHQASLVPPR